MAGSDDLGTFVSGSSVARALMGIAENLRERFAQVEAELLIRRKDGQVVCHVAGPMAEVAAAFAHLCKEFPSARLRYEPRHCYGVVARAVCACEGQEPACGTRCIVPDRQPQALVRVTRVADRDVLVGSRLFMPNAGLESGSHPKTPSDPVPRR